MVLGIPEYRLPRALIAREIEAIVELGVDVETNARIGETHSVAELLDRHAALFLAVGTGTGRDLDLPGHDLDGVLPRRRVPPQRESGLPRRAGRARRRRRRRQRGLRRRPHRAPRRLHRNGTAGTGCARCRRPTDDARRAMTTTLDVARAARRAGVLDVTIIALESPEEIPADPEEIDEAEREGIRIVYRRGPHRFVGNGRVTGLETIAVTSVFDADGRFAPTFEPGTEAVHGGRHRHPRRRPSRRPRLPRRRRRPRAHPLGRRAASIPIRCAPPIRASGPEVTSHAVRGTSSTRSPTEGAPPRRFTACSRARHQPRPTRFASSYGPGSDGSTATTTRFPANRYLRHRPIGVSVSVRSRPATTSVRRASKGCAACVASTTSCSRRSCASSAVSASTCARRTASRSPAPTMSGSAPSSSRCCSSTRTSASVADCASIAAHPVPCRWCTRRSSRMTDSTRHGRTSNRAVPRSTTASRRGSSAVIRGARRSVIRRPIRPAVAHSSRSATSSCTCIRSRSRTACCACGTRCGSGSSPRCLFGILLVTGHLPHVRVHAVGRLGLRRHAEPEDRRRFRPADQERASLVGALDGARRRAPSRSRLLRRRVQEAARVQLGDRRDAAAAHARLLVHRVSAARGTSWRTGRSPSARTSCTTSRSSAASSRTS